MIEIRTERLELRPMTMGDLPALVAQWDDPRAMRYLPTGQPRSAEATRVEAAFMEEHWQQHGFGVFAVRFTGQEEMLGYCGLQFLHVEPDGVSEEALARWPGEVEILYGVLPGAWGQGIASEAARACLRLGFEVLDLARIVAAIHPENGASGRILTEKLGLRPAPGMDFYGAGSPHFALQALDYQAPDEPFYYLSDDRDELNLESVAAFLSRAYWAQGRPLEVIQRSIQHSLCLGIYERGRQAAFARLVTDYATFAWLCDVFVDESERGHGLGKWLMSATVHHPELQGLRRLLLATRDAHGLYSQFGFTPLAYPDKWMERFRL